MVEQRKATTELKFCCGLFLHLFTTELKLCDQQVQPLQLTGVHTAAFRSVDPGGVDAAVAQNIRQTGEVTLQRIIGSGKQVAQIMEFV